MANNSGLYGNNPPVPVVSSSDTTSLYGGPARPIPDVSGNVVIRGDLAVNGGDITTTADHASLFNTNAEILDIGGEATTLNLGATTGTTTVNNNLAVAGNESVGIDLTVGNDIGVGNDLVVTNNANVGVDLTVGNDLAVGLDAVIGNDLSIGNDLTVGNNVCIDGDTITLRCNATVPGSALIEVNRGGGLNDPATFTWDEDYPVPGPANPNGRWVANAGITATGGTFGYVDIGPNNSDALITTYPGSGQTLILDSDTNALRLKVGTITLNPDATFQWDEDSDRTNRLNFQSSTGDTSGIRVLAPNATTSASATVSAFNTDDIANGLFINLNARGSLTDPLRIQTGKYTASILGASGTSVAFVDNTTTYATVNPAGPTIATDLATKAYVDSHELNTTYTIDATATTGGANFNLRGSDSTTDTIKFASGSGITVSDTDANTITITNSGVRSITGTTNQVIASSSTGAVTLSLPQSIATTSNPTFAGLTAGDITVGLTNNTSIATIAGDLHLEPATSIIGLNPANRFEWAEGSNRLNRLNFMSSTGNTSGTRVMAPNATTSAQAQMGAFATNDLSNGEFITVRASGSTTAPYSILTGKYTSNVLGASGKSINFIDNATTYASVNPSGPTVGTDLVTKTYVDALPHVTYNIDASSTTGGANLNLTGSDLTTDSVAYKGAGATTVTRTDANTITITSTDTNTTYTQDVSSTTGGANVNLVGSDSTTDSVAYKGAGSVTVTATNASTVTISATDTNTTYTQNASSVTGGAGLNLVGSDSTTDTVSFIGTGGTTVTRTDADTITISSTSTIPNQLVNGLYTFTLNADGSVDTPSSITAAGPLTLRGGIIDQTSLVLDSSSSVTTLTSGLGGDASTLSLAAGSLNWNHVAGGMVFGSVDGTWSMNADGTTSLPNFKFPYADGSSNQVLKTDGSGVLSWYTPTDTNTTYTYAASAATGGANLTLTGSDSTTNIVKVTSGTGITVADVSGTEISVTNTGVLSVASGGHITATTVSGAVTLGSDATNANTPSTIIARDSNGDFTAGTITANTSNGNYILGQEYVTRNTSYVPPASPLTTIAGVNGLVVASSNPGSGNGYSPQVKIVYASGDTTSGTNSAAVLQYSASTGTTTSPVAVVTNQTVGTLNYDGYATTGWASAIATTGSGGGTSSINPLQVQGYAVSAFTDSAGTVTNAPMGFRVRGFAASTNLSVANRVNFIDHQAATATYKATTFNIQPPTTTTNMLTLGATTGAIQQNTLSLNNSAGTTTYAQFAAGGHTIGNIDNPTTFVRARTATAAAAPVIVLKNTTTATAAPVTGDGGTFRISTAGSNATVYQLAEIRAAYSSTGDDELNFAIANGDQTGATLTSVTTLNTKPSVTTIYAGTPSATPGATTVAAKLTIDATKVTAAVPFVFPNYSATALRAITGAVGWMACVNNSASGSNPNGMMAFWDTTNTRWSYVHDNSAV